jgi:multidrug transporter EmrE-like cation transporter
VPGYLCLSVAICSEVAGTLALRYTHGFMKLLPSLIVIVAYSLAFYAVARAA